MKMAEPVRPLSRRQPRITPDPSALTQNVPRRSARKTKDYKDFEGYEQYARSKSRKGMNSGNTYTGDQATNHPRTNRNQKTRTENWDPGPQTTTSVQQQQKNNYIERPKTGHGSRRHATEMSVQSTKNVSATFTAPKMNKNQLPQKTITDTTNYASPSTEIHSQTYERPKTGHGRRRPMAETSQYVAPQQIDHQPQTYSMEFSKEQVKGQQIPYERPKTGHGRRRTSHASQEQPLTQEPYERPRTGRERRQLSEDVPPSPTPQDEPADPYERPKTSHGRRQSTISQISQDNLIYSPRQGPEEVNILTLDNPPAEESPTPKPRAMRPKSAKGRYRPPKRQPQEPETEFVQPPIQYRPSGYTPQEYTQPEMVHQTGPSITPQPVAFEHHDTSPNAGMSVTITQRPGSSRPTSAASLSKFKPLPSISRARGVVIHSEMDAPISTPRSISSIPSSTPTPRSARQSSFNLVGLPENDIQLCSTQLENCDMKENNNQNQTTSSNDIGEESVEKRTAPIPTPRQSVLANKSQNANQTLTADNPASGTSPQLHKVLERQILLPSEPKEDEDRLMLAIKLPTGERAQRYFRPTDTLELVVNFAESSTKLDFTGYELVTCEVPRKVYKDLHATIEDAGIANRTVLHIQLPDD